MSDLGRANAAGIKGGDNHPRHICREHLHTWCIWETSVTIWRHLEACGRDQGHIWPARHLENIWEPHQSKEDINDISAQTWAQTDPWRSMEDCLPRPDWSGLGPCASPGSATTEWEGPGQAKPRMHMLMTSHLHLCCYVSVECNQMVLILSETCSCCLRSANNKVNGNSLR